MALKATVNFKGINVADAYVKVVNFSGDKNSLAFQVGNYGPANESGERELFDSTHRSCDYALDGSNALQQAYTYLKTLPEFAGAKDC